MIYFAGVSQNVGTVCAIFLVVAGLVFLVGGMIYAVHAAVEEERYPAPERFLRNLAISWFCIAILGSVIPSSGTIYAIAASEYGEKIAKTETADKAVKALNAWLDRQIKSDGK